MMLRFKRIGVSVTIIVGLFFINYGPAQAQLSLDLEIDEMLSSSQSINFQSIIASNWQGPRLFQMYLQNNSSEHVHDLYMRIIMESNNRGRLVDLEQVSGRPFSLNPGQQVVATNNNISRGLPSVEEAVVFNGGLTEAGKEFINELKGLTSLPPDEYQVSIEIFEGSVGGTLLASTTGEVGKSIVEDTYDFYLLSPGDEIGSEETISNSYPNFQWEGTTNVSYRLLVVEGREDDSPQSLMDGAASTDPIQSDESTSSGSLVDYEMLDVIVDKSSFQYPTSGVQELEPGQTYYWRVINQLRTSNGVEARESEIWSFSIADNQEPRTVEQDSEVTTALKQVLGNQFEQMQQDGFSFQSIVIDGQTYQDVQALQKLMELGRDAQQGNISIVIEEQ